MGTTQRKSIRPLFGLGLLCALLFLLATLINALDGLVDLYERAAAISPWLPWLLHGLLGGFLLIALGFIARQSAGFETCRPSSTHTVAVVNL